MSVKVVKHPETGNVITVSTKNPKYGTVRLDESHTSFENGFVNTQKRTAFLRGEVVALEALNLQDGAKLPGKIVKRESYQPFYEGQSPKIYPEGSERAGQPVLKNGRETYLEYVYTANNSADPDVWVGEDIAVASEQAQGALAEQATGN